MDTITDNTSAQDLYGSNAILGNEDDATPNITVVDNSGTSQQINISDDNDDDKSPLDDTVTEDPTETPVEESEKTEDPLEESINKSTETLKAVSDDLSKKGVDFNKVIQEYNSNGDLGAETREALRKAGYPDTVIDGFIQSRQVLSERYTEQVYNYAGGEEKFNNLIQWAGNNLSNEEVNAFNKAIDDGNLTVVKMMLDGISSKRVAKYGTRNPSIVGNTAGNKASLTGFASRDEIVKAMSDRRYETDAKYRHEVERRMLLTDIF